MTALVDVAHCRAGDKGSDSLLVVVPYDPGDLDQLARYLTPSALARHFATETTNVSVREAAGALVVRLQGRLGGGVTRSVGVDPHGKTLSGHLLALEVQWT